MMPLAKKKVRLVLAAGGARGVAHIGVIEKLEEAGCEIIEVVGCSMGAVIGGLYAAGHLPAYRQWLLSLDRATVFKQMDFTLTRHGFVKGEKVFNTISEMFGSRNIEDLPIPFAAVATELKNGQEVVFREGELFQALRASISIPGIFTPVHHPGGQWVDGGVVNPLPLNLVQRQNPDEWIVAVNINAPGPPILSDKGTVKNPLENTWLKLNLPFWKKESAKVSGGGLIDVVQVSYEHMQNRLIAMMTERYPPDLLVSIPRQSCGMFDFHKSAELIAVGRKAYEQALSAKEKKELSAGSRAETH